MINDYIYCFIIGFSISITSSILFFIGYWAVGRVYEYYLNWKNPWRKLEGLLTKY